MNNINLELLAVDGKARVNKVKINNHEFNTPIFDFAANPDLGLI